MAKLSRDIMSLSTFKRDSNKVMRQMKKNERAGRTYCQWQGGVVIQDAESYQQRLELKERAEVIETLRQRLASKSRKKGRTADEFFAEFFAQNIPVED